MRSQIEQLFLEHALDAVPGGENRADCPVFAGGLDYALQTAVDDRGGAAALGNHQIARDVHIAHLQSVKTMILSPFPTSNKVRMNRSGGRRTTT